MPCNVVVREDARGTVQVEFLDPKPLFELTGRPEVEPLAKRERSSGRDGILARGSAHERADARGKVSLLAIQEIVAQRSPDRAKRELFPRYFVFAEQPHLEAFGAGAEVEIEEPRPEH